MLMMFFAKRLKILCHWSLDKRRKIKNMYRVPVQVVRYRVPVRTDVHIHM
jgi:hypothetical protein